MIVTYQGVVVMRTGRQDQRFTFRVIKPELPRVRLETFRGGRTCSKSGCHTKLSIYNSRDECWQHAQAQPYFPMSKTSAA